jgi:WD40 repeat protein
MRTSAISTGALLLLFIVTTLAQKPELAVQTGHAAQVLTLAYTKDGKLLASGSVDNTIKFWDPSTGNELRTLKGHDGTVMSVAFSPDERLLASGSADNSAKIWDVATSTVRQTLAGHSLYVSSVQFSPDGKLLATASADQQVKIWDVITGREIRTVLPNIDPKYSIGLRVLFTRDGKTLITAGEVIKFWDVASGKLLHTIKIEDTGPIPVLAIALSPDSKVLATGSRNIKLWDVPGGNPLRTISSGADLLSFSSDGQTLAATSMTDIKTFNVSTGAELKSWEGVAQGVDSLTFNPDGKTIASGNSDNTIRVWDSRSGAQLKVLKGYTDRIASLALSANGKVLASGSIGTIGREDSIRIWDPSTGQLLHPLSAGYVTHSIELNHDGSRLVAAGGGSSRMTMWNVSQGQLKTFKFPQSGPNSFLPAQVTISQDGRYIAAGARNGAVKLLEADTEQEIFTEAGHAYDVRAITFSPRGDVFASSGSSRDKTIKIWSTRGALLRVLKAHAGAITALAFSPDGTKLASGSQDKAVILWDVTTGNAEDSFAGNTGWVNALAFSRDGSKLASGSEDGVVRMWDVRTRRPLHTLLGHRDNVSSAVFSADDKLLITSSWDSSIKLWDVTEGKELGSLFALGQQDWLVVTPEGLFDGSPAAWSQILWRFSQNMFDVAPVELFFNEYYYPGLLAELYRGKRPVPPKNLFQRDRRQPTVALNVSDKLAGRSVSVKIEVGPAPAGAQDVRLFRNGALVKAWRGDVLKGQLRAVLEVQVPIVAGQNRFTAYAFNRDNIKSGDATAVVQGAESLKQPGTMYILAIAVNKYANPQFDLRFAVADATDFAAELERQEAKLKNFARTEITSLHDTQATKANILRALGELAGKVKPEDAVVVYYAGHGTAQQNQFYLIPHDLGYQGPRNSVSAAGLASVLSHSISDRELERAFETIDAGKLMLIIDACNSGQALEAEEKRRGPMNSKGLAQLAYEKGIYILTAAQSYQAALEPSDLKHGLLTYALVEEGLKKEAADNEPRDGTLLVREWFSYVMSRVPQLQEQRMKQASAGGRQLVYLEGDEDESAEKRNVQRPRVFYRRELEEHPFKIAVFAAAP